MKYAVILCRGLSQGIFSGEKDLLSYCKKPNIDALAAGADLGIVKRGTGLVSALMYEMTFQTGVVVSDHPFLVCDSGAVLNSGDVCVSCCIASVISAEDEVSVCRADLTGKQTERLCAYLSPLISDDVFELVFAGNELCLIWRGGEARGCSFSSLTLDPVPKDSVMPHGDISKPFCRLIDRSAELLSEYGDLALWPERSITVPSLAHVEDTMGMTAALCGADRSVRGLCRAIGMETFSNAAAALESPADVLFFDIDLSEDTGSRMAWLDGKLLPRLLSRTENILILPLTVEYEEFSPPVPFLMHRSDTTGTGTAFDAASCARTGVFVPDVGQLMKLFIS